MVPSPRSSYVYVEYYKTIHGIVRNQYFNKSHPYDHILDESVYRENKIPDVKIMMTIFCVITNQTSFVVTHSPTLIYTQF